MILIFVCLFYHISLYPIPLTLMCLFLNKVDSILLLFFNI